ncbi:MAG: DUF3347 domain-containing protein [Chitinophagaceae bacterium]
MKIGWLIVVIIAIIAASYFLFFYKKDEKPAAPKPQPLAISKNNNSFNTSFNDLLNSYYSLKNAFINWDTANANVASNNMIDNASKINYDNLKADSSIILTAKNFSDNVIAEAKGLIGEPTIDGKRHSFYTLSENLYNLIRTVHYDQTVIYHDKCPMAFGDDEEAYWITNNRKIENPYLGNKHPKYHSAMVSCGSIEDSIDFRQK